MIRGGSIVIVFIFVCATIIIQDSVIRNNAATFKKRQEEILPPEPNAESRNMLSNLQTVETSDVPKKLLAQESSNVPSDVPPDYVGCFEQVKNVLNSTMKTKSFCEAPCVQELSYYLNKEGVHLSRFKPIKKHNNTSSRSSIYVNSPGGVGSSFFIEVVTNLDYRTNNARDKDQLKHRTPFSLLRCESKNKRCRKTFSYQSIYERSVRGKYNAIINVFGPPDHAIFSLYNRHYEGLQYSKLNRGKEVKKIPKAWKKNITAIFAAAAKAESDVFGIEQYVHQWMDLQDIATFGFGNKTMLTPELRKFQKSTNSGDDYLKSTVKDFPPIFITDIATARAAPAVFAALLGVTIDKLERIFASSQNRQFSEKKLTKEEEREIVEKAGATQIFAKLEEEMQQRIKQNYLMYGVAMFCSSSSSNTLQV